MFRYGWRQAKRLFIILVGLSTTWVIVRRLFPWLNEHLPLLAALCLTYVIGSYAIVPLVIRGMRMLFRPHRIPLYTTTPDGFACDPVNIGIIGSEAAMLEAMRLGGWQQADRRTPKTVMKMIRAFILNRPYPTAPFSSLILFGRTQDFGFQKPVSGSPAQRHHVRFWSCVSRTSDPHHQAHVSFWRSHPHIPKDIEVLWVGAATKDIGLGIIRHNAQFTHAIDPDTNAERDFIIRTLEDAGAAKSVRRIAAGKPYTLRNRVLGITMIADGELKLVRLNSAETIRRKRHTETLDRRPD
jgi:hypothetical protein